MQMKSSVFKYPVNSTLLIKCTMIERWVHVRPRPGVRVAYHRAKSLCWLLFGFREPEG